MYALTSTAGLNTTAPTLEQAATILGQHLHDLAPDGPIHWTITAPWGGVPHTGHLRLNGLPDDGFIADAIAEVTEDLRAASRPIDTSQRDNHDRPITDRTTR